MSGDFADLALPVAWKARTQGALFIVCSMSVAALGAALERSRTGGRIDGWRVDSRDSLILSVMEVAALLVAYWALATGARKWRDSRGPWYLRIGTPGLAWRAPGAPTWRSGLFASSTEEVFVPWEHVGEIRVEQFRKDGGLLRVDWRIAVQRMDGSRAFPPSLYFRGSPRALVTRIEEWLAALERP